MTDAYGHLFRELLFPAWETVLRGRPTLRHLALLERTQWASLDELRALQERELGRLLRHAVLNVPYYRQLFLETGLSSRDVRCLEDLPKIPRLTREGSHEAAERRQSKAPPLTEVRKMTSGSTGSPLAFGYDRGSEYWRNAAKLRGYAWAGYRPGDRSLHFWGRIDALHDLPIGRRAKAALDHALRREHYLDCSDHSEPALARVVEAIRALEPSVIFAYSRSAAALARHVVQTQSRDWDDITVVCGAEPVYASERDVLTRAFGPRSFETYGSRETMLIASECEAHAGLHVAMENLVVELVVRENGVERPAAVGEVGEVVVTDLHNYGMPFIRYANGDLAVALAPGRCACGRSLMRLASVEGRANDTLHDGAGRPVSSMFFVVFFSVMAHKVREFQVVQHRDRSIDLQLVPAPELDEALLTLLRRDCSKYLPGTALRIHVVDAIAAGPGGKRRAVMVEA